ncbi:hypothetical protein FM042_01035 [Aliidiomarina halalkaliphila]|uniref:Type II secretion system protein GspF domain-containing protein n=1 Tax=Aliidiomarina halalkaliphila TaxID=2593535 RepID=A0A552X363_9GAMM|nr:type II secretion system F family protein [Aliidiomarina halalkaliphila]TRW49480.1 hypothetical protein FM042_01035 [Aliidiomarina halalkaliphila]
MHSEVLLAWLTALLFALAAITWAYCVIVISLRIKHDYQQEYVEKLQRNLTELWLFIPWKHWVALWLLVCMFVVVVLLTLNIGWWLVVTGLIIGSCAPWLALRWLRKKRQQTFIKQLPDALMLLANVLATGGSLHRSIDFVSREMPPPLGQEFSLVVRHIRLGQSLAAGFTQLYQRIPHGDVQRVVLTIALTQQVGGQQARILQRCAYSLRKKLSLQQRIESISAQGRLQGKVMSCLPLLLLLVFGWMESDAIRVLSGEPLGWVLLFSLVTLLTVGQWWIARLVKIPVPL